MLSGAKHLRLVLGRGERLPVKDEVFQLVLCTHVLESLPTNVAQETVSESRSAMAGGGFLFVATAASDDGYDHAICRWSRWEVTSLRRRRVPRVTNRL